MKQMIASAGVLILAATGCRAQSGLKTRSVSMFNNGYTYVVRSGQVACPSGVFSLRDKEIPAAAAGTIWFSSDKGISHAEFRRDTTRKMADAANVMQLLRANTGRKVTITCMMGSGQPLQYTGEITAVVYDTASATDYMEGLLMLKTEKGPVSIFRNMLNYSVIEFSGEGVHRIAQSKVTGNLNVYLKGSPNTADLSMAWVQQQQAWEPTYRLQLSGNKKARLQLNADISSPGFEMNGADLNLVLASPQVLNGARLSRLTGSGEWYSANLGDASGQYMPEDAMIKAPLVRSVAREGNDDVQVSADKAADYYIYRLKNISLRPGAHAQVPILSADLDVAHIYHSALPAATEYNILGTEDPTVQVYHPVYHKIRTKNTLTEPWAPAALMLETEEKNGNIFISQVYMPATPPGETAYVTVDKSSDMVVQQSEEEKSRQTGALSIPGRTGGYTVIYDKITVSVTMKLANRSGDARQMMLNRSVQGKMLSSDAGWKVVSAKSVSGSPNGNNQVSWELSLNPGEEKVITYTYEVYIRSN